MLGRQHRVKLLKNAAQKLSSSSGIDAPWGTVKLEIVVYVISSLAAELPRVGEDVVTDEGEAEFSRAFSLFFLNTNITS